jgi:hypothetical protein
MDGGGKILVGLKPLVQIISKSLYISCFYNCYYFSCHNYYNCVK